MMERLFAWSLTYIRTWTLSLCFTSKTFICKAKTPFVVSTILKNPMVTWQSSHLSFEKCTIRTKISTPPYDIQRSKLMVQVLHEASEMDTKFSLVFFATLSNRPFLETCFNGKSRWRFSFKTNFLKYGASMNDNGTSSLLINNKRSSSNCFWWGSSLGQWATLYWKI